MIRTLAPCFAKVRTMPLPIPRAPPVTMATLPASDIFFLWLLESLPYFMVYLLEVCVCILDIQHGSSSMTGKAITPRT